MNTPARDAYQIGWICALPMEVAAAKQMLDENFGILEDQDSKDTNSYTLGRVGRHFVVIAGQPAGQYGATSATTVAVNMMRTFSRSLRIGLMVGIGGGIPSDNRDIRLGDIVVSYPEGTCGGVLQYDMGKVVTEGNLQRTGSLNSPPRSLLTAVANMSASALADDPTYPDYIEKAIQRNARTQRNFGRPNASTDRLFQFEREHPTTAPTCDACLPEWEESRDTREEAYPQVHYGIIASGNAVMKHGATRERLRQETGALCFEMEAAGLMMDFPCIVIRGICDYADSHKNKQWQGYAALAAASYAKELLSYVPVVQVSHERLVTEICSEIVGEVKEINKGMERSFQQREVHHLENMQNALTKEQQRCHQAFKTSTYEQYKNINPDRADGTCRWVLENPQYLAWQKSSHNDLLWISADPGCGKSVLAKSLVDNDLKASTLVSVCYFFFKDNVEQNNLATALCAVLHQLFGMQPNLLRHAWPSWQTNGTKLQKEVDELWRILVASISDPTYSSTVCIFDALDECRPSDRTQLIRKLETFYTQGHSTVRQSWLKFLVTSRPYGEIQEGFRPATRLFPHIHIRGEEENNLIHEEISLVVKIRVAELGESLQLSPEIQQRLEHQLIQMEHRTYLWLYLAMDDIRTTFRNSLQPEEESIQLIPGSVSAAYAKILNRVPPNKASDVRLILQIIICARRPLTIEEMAIALGIARRTHFRTAAKTQLNPDGLDLKIRQLCGLFVFVNNSRVYLIHQTAREFLMNRSYYHEWSVDLNEAEELMSEVCARYLLFDAVNEANMGVSPSQVTVKTSNFMWYAAKYWPDHVREISPQTDSQLDTCLDQLYDIPNPSFALWYPIFWGAMGPYLPRTQMDSIHLAAFNGHKNMVQKLIRGNKSLINQADEAGMSALHWASSRGHHEIVEILLDKGADVNFQGGIYGTALCAASSRGHTSIVQILLDKGADVNAKGGEGRSFDNALYAACEVGCDKIVQILLGRGAKVNVPGGFHGYALHAACDRGHIKIVQVLLDQGAEVNAQGGCMNTALQAACQGGHIKIVQALLDQGAEVNTQGGQYGNALAAASYTGHAQIVQILLDQGANVNAQGGHFGSALCAAASKGHLEIVQILLDNEAEVNDESEVGGDPSNALHEACRGGHVEVVQMLLDMGAEVKTQGGRYGNALKAVSRRGCIDAVQILLDKGAEVNAQGGRYGNALQAASEGGHLNALRMLLDKGAEVYTQGGLHGNALQAASERGHLKITQVLLDKGEEANARTGEYGVAFQAASDGRPGKRMRLNRNNPAPLFSLSNLD